ncbi:hypothetical protein B0T11DRAFT_24810 [Plectosphaerella cucumerina]|uniref:Zn(2)-C6 fungal-type domain-containing protein n=1 Tax=Plectosphaerella cucumerina TaxID=40658 RepID=A0A8K0X9D5_9PEZI|nr:hypothetical protein B0T11DRAFT_24810 [Plectosphaerella cucumerina]
MSSRQETRSRRRAAKACSYCRKRKRKCDGRTPVCSLCEEYNDSQCVYEPTQLRRSAATRAENRDEAASGPQTTDATRDSTLLRASFGDADAATPELSRLDREQNRIEESRRHATCPVLGSPASQDRGFEGSFPTSSPCSAETVSTAGTVDSHTDAAMAIPLAHQTTTGDLLHSEAGRQLLGEYPADLFLRIEARRFTPIDISLDLDRDAKDPENPLSECDDVYIKHLLDVFFDQAHPQIPIFSRDQVMRMLPEAVASPAMSLESALISLLASIASTLLEEPDTTSGEWTPGHRFFKPALRSIVAKWHTDFSGDLILAQSLFMAAVYYSHLARPLQAWRMVHLASTCVQHHTVSSRQLVKLEQMILRLCWAIFNLEW